MADIVERLQSHMYKADMSEVLADCRIAADEIAALRARCEKAEEALEPFSRFAGPVFERNFNNDDPVDTITTSDGEQVTLFARDYFAARAAVTSYRKRSEADG